MTYFIFKHRTNNLYDVWLDDSWDNWAKVIVTKQNAFVVQGQRISTSLLKEIHKCILE